MNQCIRFFIVAVAVLLHGVVLRAQVTTANLRGHIQRGASAVENANLELTNKATGEKYTTTTDSRGNYVFFNIPPGEKYQLRISSDAGDATQNIVIRLGDGGVFDYDFAQVLETARVTAYRSAKQLHGNASTTVNTKLIMQLPSFNRSLSTLMALVPQSNGSSMAGMNARFNNITIDGAVANGMMGLHSGNGGGLPGASVGTQPISLDAIGEVQIVLSPYSVQYGNFTGGSVNAVTRSGTNKVEGSAYAFTKHNSLTGKDPVTNLKTDRFSEYTVGARLGGPIVQNKLFYFVNYEYVRNSTPTLYNVGEGAMLSEDSARWLQNLFRTKFNYDIGSYGRQNLLQENHKALVKLTYRLSSHHRMSLRLSTVAGSQEKLDRRLGRFYFSNAGVHFRNRQYVSVFELESRLASNMFNTLIVGYTHLEDLRFIKGKYFPNISINTNEHGRIDIGSNNYAQNNILRQNIFEITDNLRIRSGGYTFTFGTHNEFVNIFNAFIARGNGQWTTRNIALSALEALDNKTTTGNKSSDLFARVGAGYPLYPNGERIHFYAGQLSAYAQGESEYLRGRLRLTAGMRIDLPVFFNRPAYNRDFSVQYGIQNDVIPQRLLYSPRLSFRFDPTVRKNITVRGGVGLFSGRVPFVWITNVYSNNGLSQGSFDYGRSKGLPNFNPDIAAIPTLYPDVSLSVSTIDKNFRFPQVLRANLGLDLHLPGDVYMTVEAIFSQNVSNVMYQFINLDETKVKNNVVPLSGAAVVAAKHSPDIRYKKADGTIDNNRSYGGNVYHLLNTGRGYTYNVSVQARKDFHLPVERAGVLSAFLAYTYGRAFDVSSAGSSIAASSFGNNAVPGDAHFNRPPLAISNYELRHRIISTLQYSVPYTKNLELSVFFFLRSNSGTPFSLSYNNYDLNGDNWTSNDLVYIPTQAQLDASTAISPVERQAIKNFIASSPALISQQGGYMERNSLVTPWETVVDMRVLHNFSWYTGEHKHTVQLSWEVFNLTNLLNTAWGRNYSPTGNLTLWGNFNGAKNGMRRIGKRFLALKDFYAVEFNSRWQMQLGVRYFF